MALKLPDPGSALGERPTPQPAGGVVGVENTRPFSPGAAIEHTAQLLGKFATEQAHEAKVEEERVNTLRAEEAFNKLRDRQHELTFGDVEGFMNVKGSAAVSRTTPIPKEWGGKFEQSAKDIEASLANDQQKALFRKRALIAQSSFTEDAYRHLAKESDVYSDEVFKGTVTTEVRSATENWASPGDLSLSLERVRAATEARAERLNWPPEYKKAVLQEKQGQIHQTVVQQALAQGNYEYAEAWANDHKGDMPPAIAAAVSKAVEDGTQKQVSADYRSDYLANQNDAKTLRELNDRVLGDKKLDDTRRNVLVSQIQNRVLVLDHRQELARERQLRTLERGIGELNANTLAGFPPTEDQFGPYIAAAKGTELEPQIQAAVGLAKATDAFRNQPPAAQERLLAEAESGVRTDPSKFDRKIVGAWRSIYDSQREQVQRSPVTFAVRQGLIDPPAPIDLSQPQSTGPALEQRFAIARGVAGRYQAPFKPLTEEEAKLLSATLKVTPPAERGAYFGKLAQAAGNDYEGYSAIMGQIAPDDPATAVAGQYAFRGRTQASEAILAGQAMLHPNKKEDGSPDKGKLWPMPPEADLRKGFQSYEKDAFAGHAGARNAMYQSALAIYAKKSSDEGDATGVLNGSRWEDAMRLATGGIEKYNGKAIVLPYGFEYGQFRDGLSKRVDQVVDSGRLAPGMTKDRLHDMPLEAIGDGRYVFKAGNGILVDKESRAIVIDFNNSLPFHTSGEAPYDTEPTPVERAAASAAVTGRAAPPAKRKASTRQAAK